MRHFPGTWRNRERTGERPLSRLSGIARHVGNVRHTDIDLTQWCPACRRPQVFAEVKSAPARDGEWDQCRRHASFYAHGCLAMLVIEGAGCLGMRVYDSRDGRISNVKYGDEEMVTAVLGYARDIHRCWLCA